MKRKDSKDASPQATPFFARYLEGQDAGADAEAKVGEGRAQSNFTYNEARGTKKGSAKKSGAKKSGAKKGGAKKGGAKKGGAKKGAAGGAEAKAKPPMQTLKYPSDRDELVFYAYHPEAADAKTSRVTLKYPSDNDEGQAYYAVYSDASEAPRSEAAAARAKPKETGVRLSHRKPKG